MQLRETCSILAGILASIIIFALPFISEIQWTFRTTCIHVPSPIPSTNSLGSLYQRSQLAFFLSQHLSAKLSLASHPAFSHCKPPKPSCILKEDELILPRCDPGDCVCHAQKIAPYLKQVSHCQTIQLTVDRFLQAEFSGCTGDAVTRYITPRNGSYNVLVHSGKGIKPMLLSEADYIQRQICKSSDKPIVVITSYVTKVPLCENRTLLAPDLDGETIVSLIAGAENVGTVGGEIVHMGVAGMKGGRLIMTARTIPFFDWAQVDVFTVVGPKNAVFHFDSAEVMRLEVSGDRYSRLETRRSRLKMGESEVSGEIPLKRDFPERRWSRNETLV